jgi:hypothetical protein
MPQKEGYMHQMQEISLPGNSHCILDRRGQPEPRSTAENAQGDSLAAARSHTQLLLQGDGVFFHKDTLVKIHWKLVKQ